MVKCKKKEDLQIKCNTLVAITMTENVETLQKSSNPVFSQVKKRQSPEKNYEMTVFSITIEEHLMS